VPAAAAAAGCLPPQLQGMLSPFGELKDCVVIVEKMSQKSKVRDRESMYKYVEVDTL
jgi:hypothetical protein